VGGARYAEHATRVDAPRRHQDNGEILRWHNAEATADALWAAVGNSQGNTHERNKNGGREIIVENKYRREDLNLHDLAVTGF
jgi:hypothetical protein